MAGRNNRQVAAEVAVNRNNRQAAVNTLRRLQATAEADDFAELTLIQVKIRAKLLTKTYDEFVSIHRALVAKERDQNVVENEHDVLAAEIEAVYLEVLGRFETRAVELAPAAVVAPAHPANEPQQIRVVVRNNDLKDALGKFDGALSKWPAFRDRFVAIIHENGDLDSATKMRYLSDAMVGRAAHTLGDWQSPAENYDEAWTHLKEVYEKPYLIRQTLVKKLWSMPIMTRPSYDGIRSLIDNAQNTLRQLAAIGAPTQHWDLIVITLLQERLDVNTSLEWERQRPNEDPTLAHMYEFLERQANIMLTSSHADRHDRNFVRPARRVYNDDIQMNPKREIHHGHDEKRRRSEVARPQVPAKYYNRCPNCQGNHPLHSCRQWQSLVFKERDNFVKSRKLCESCFKWGHTAEECFDQPCRLCPGAKKHSTWLCPTKEAQMRVHQLELGDLRHSLKRERSVRKSKQE